ncbi:MAG: nucleotidyltransferase domain-containing protein [Planctomycetes bacterium]|nr:nucleotidyltransferase domain-containing protein [Planctomycetota bacterium]
MNPKILQMLTELRHALEKLYGPSLNRLLLYGSQARGDSTDGSDVDVLVVLSGNVSPGEEIARTGQLVTDLSLKYDKVISCVFISSDRFENEHSPLLQNVRKEGVSL